VKHFGPGSFYLQIKSSDMCTIPKLNASCWNIYRGHMLIHKHGPDLRSLMRCIEAGVSTHQLERISALCAHTKRTVQKIYFVCSSCMG